MIVKCKKCGVLSYEISETLDSSKCRKCSTRTPIEKKPIKPKKQKEIFIPEVEEISVVVTDETNIDSEV